MSNVSGLRDVPSRALVVDDDPLGLVTTSEMLDRLGITNDVIPDPGDALIRAQKVRYDYIFLDINMPGLNGLQLCSAIREIGSASRNALIAALSGHIYDKVQVAACLRAGMCDVLSKPITGAQLQKRMDYWNFALRNADILAAGDAGTRAHAFVPGNPH